MMNGGALISNLHISLTNFKNEGRVLKETRSIISHGIAEKVFIAALHEEDLQEHESISNKINLKRFHLASRYLPKNFFWQAIKYIEFLIRVWWYYKKKSIKMINVHSLGLLPLGVFLKYCYGAKLIYDTHELETEINGLNGFRKKLAKITEKSLIRFVDQTFVVSQSIADEYSRMYQGINPVVILNCPYYTPPIKSNLFREHFGISQDVVIFLYQGGLSKERGICSILEAFKTMQDPRKVIVFMGYGPLEKEIKEASSKYSNIYFYPAVPVDEVLKYTSAADVGIHFIKNTCLNHYYCMPNKLFEYIGGGLPVIVSNVYEMASFVNKYKVGVVARDDTPQALLEAIDEIYKTDLTVLKRNTLEVARKFCWEVQEKGMISAYQKLFS